LAGVTAASQATKKAASAAVGFVGLVSYGANLFTGYGIGALSDRFGGAFWDYLFLILAIVSILGGLCFVVTWNARDGYERAKEHHLA
jgi:sugar phosphate permease